MSFQTRNLTFRVFFVVILVWFQNFLVFLQRFSEVGATLSGICDLERRYGHV